MDWIEIIVLAIVQGLTEFIPISSTAHLRIVPALLGWKDPGAALSAVIQIGTLVAVLWYFWRDVVRILAAMLADLRRGKLATTHDARLGWMIAARHAADHRLRPGLSRAHQDDVALAVRDERRAGRRGAAAGNRRMGDSAAQRRRSCKAATWIKSGWRDAIVIGFAQAAALVPGTSRSGATILGGLCCGLTREAAARFSFLLSIPSIFAAGVFELIEARERIAGQLERSRPSSALRWSSRPPSVTPRFPGCSPICGGARCSCSSCIASLLAALLLALLAGGWIDN